MTILAAAGARADVLAVLIIDSEAVVREGLRLMLRRAGGFRIVDTVKTAEDAVRAAQNDPPDLVVLEARLPDALAPELCQQLLECVPTCRIVVFTRDRRSPLAEAALGAGAAAVIQKNAEFATLLSAFRATDRVEAQEPSSDPIVKPDGTILDPLTPREYDILRHVARGMTHREIAGALFLAPNTVRSYCQSILRKFGVRNRVQALEVARQHELI